MSNKESKVLQDSDGCEHLWLDYEPGPCPTCAEIKAAHERGQQDEHEAMEETVIAMIRKAEEKRGKEVLEMACLYLAWSEPFRQAYRERFGS